MKRRGQPSDDLSKTTLCVAPSVRAAVRARADELGVGVRALVEFLLERALMDASITPGEIREHAYKSGVRALQERLGYTP